MNKYNRVMNKIKVTPEMHQRIVQNIQETDLGRRQEKRNSFREYKKYFSIAACLLLCVVGTLFLPDLLKVQQGPSLEAIPNIIEYTSRSELSDAVGFEVKNVNHISFKVEQVQYVSYKEELAEIVYLGSSNELVFRMSRGSEDISGNYNDYEEEKNYSVGVYYITIKGNNGLYSVATWKDDEFTYALQLETALSAVDLMNSIQSIE